MAATTVTTLVMVAFALALLAMAGWAWFGSWQPEVRRVREDEFTEADYDAAVRQMRQAIEDYERGDRTL